MSSKKVTEGTNLDAIISAIENNQIPNAVIRAVISNRPDAFGLEHAEQKGIPTICINHQQFQNRVTFDIKLLKAIQGYKPDLVILAGFMRVLTPQFVRELKGILLNVHPSLLPKYQGLNTHQRAMEAGEKEHGCSVHYVTEDLDGGPVIAQAKVNITPMESVESLARKVQAQEHKLLPLCIQWFSQNRLAMIDNRATLDGEKLAPQGLRPTQDELNHL